MNLAPSHDPQFRGMIEQSGVVDLDRAANGRVVDGLEVNLGALLDGDILGQSGDFRFWILDFGFDF
jgi:hypothetical protein